MRKMNSEYSIQNREWLWAIAKFCVLNSLLVIFWLPSLAQKNKPYSEDLSKLRPKIEVQPETKKTDSAQSVKKEIVPTKMINAKLDVVLDSIDRFNLTRKFIDGFTIQIYSGQKRDDAMSAMKKMQEEVSSLSARLRYEQPKFRVTVGKYFTRLEAQSDLLLLKNVFSSASLVPEKIPLK
ncbi:MAG TPA: hypothetical protein DGG95_06315 [Cytophagales bacterium]|jgi:hypothetical protein|nr:hypothetical protein [Cytophagales bacterium]